MISAVILTRNEEKNIIDCIESLYFCNEIVIIDDVSTDRTVEIAKKAGAIVYEHELNNNFSKQRNFGLEKAKNEWILFIDADERISVDLKNEIKYKILKKGINGYSIKRSDFFYGKELFHGETSSISLVRLGKKNHGLWDGAVHEEWKINGKISILDTPLLHYPHPTINEFLLEINFYTDLNAMELFNKGIRATWYDVIIYPVAKFIHNFIIRAGFQDGVAGMIIAIMMSFHSFLVRAKLLKYNEN